MNERTTTEMLVRTEGASGGPAVPVSLRTESVLESPEDGRKRKRREARKARDLRYRTKYKDRLRERLKAWRQKNKAKTSAQNRRWRTRHPEQHRLASLRWREANPDKVAERERKYRSENRDKVRRWGRNNYRRHAAAKKQRITKYNQRQCDKLGDQYVRRVLSKRSTVKFSQWPTPLVELKRAELNIKRQLKHLWHNQKTSTNSATNS